MLQSAAGRALFWRPVSATTCNVMRGNTAYLFVWWSYRIRKLSIYKRAVLVDFSPASRLRVGRRAQAGTAAMSDVRFWAPCSFCCGY
eukprot:scaffold101323_cov63-Phaeocystis_antarctica.AAC.1